MREKFLSIPAVLLLAVSGAQAREGYGEGKDAPSAGEWEYNEIYEQGGIRAENLLGAEVFAENGEEIGNVENAVVNSKGQMIGLIAEVGGLWDIGDTHVAVKFEDVEFTADGVTVPITEENVDEFDLFGDDSLVRSKDLEQNANAERWRVTELLNDYATFENGVGYGYVDDVLFSKDGEIQAVVVQAGTAYPNGQFAFPFTPGTDAWTPAAASYVVPYGENDLAELEPFRYGRYESIVG